MEETISDYPDEKLKKNRFSWTKKISQKTAIAALAVLFVGGIGGAVFSGGTFYYLYRKGLLGGRIVQNVTEKVTVEEGSGVVDAVKKVSPSVVSITTTSKALSFFGGVTEQKGGGTGFVVTNDGLILTNKHVISSANALTVVTGEGKDYEGKVVALDPIFDLALIKIEANSLPVAELGDSDTLEIGQRVVAIGNALGEYQNSVTVGVVSARARAITAYDGSGSSSHLEGLLQTDAPISPGNSGGPLINIRGQVIGINTAVDAQGNSIGFALPINSAKAALNSYLKNGKITRPYMGVRYINITKEFAALNDLSATSGALVVGEGKSLAVVPGGPADKAGIKINDIITEINGDKITENRGIISILAQYAPGDSVEIKYLRAGEEAKTKVILGEIK
ncbi:trypsin-like peptidase domain-containing protein [Candidatus Microgenomates bacterium]|nr:trypsin-like peptidase domain-containing protein [Candidatus Microgenomates bacterium]